MITLMTTLWKWLLQIVDQFYKGAASPGVDLLMQMMMLMMTPMLNCWWQCCLTWAKNIPVMMLGTGCTWLEHKVLACHWPFGTPSNLPTPPQTALHWGTAEAQGIPLQFSYSDDITSTKLPIQIKMLTQTGPATRGQISCHRFPDLPALWPLILILSWIHWTNTNNTELVPDFNQALTCATENFLSMQMIGLSNKQSMNQ